MLDALLMKSSKPVGLFEPTVDFRGYTTGSVVTNTETGAVLSTRNLTGVYDDVLGENVAVFGGNSEVILDVPSIGTGDYTLECLGRVDISGTFVMASNLNAESSGTTNSSCSIAQSTVYYFPSGLNNTRPSTVAPLLGEWVHLVNMRSNGIVYCFLNGTKILEFPFTSNVSQRTFSIGCYRPGSGGANRRYLKGKIAMVGFKNEAIYPTSGFQK